ncbi:ABC transporter permease [Anaerocolumna sp. AGMB13020]|uniref:ABC transporter permease n=1 Tax=Anaerocolumna sp. AGMB13020 TaxID=3081750 RepID=UPI0029546729|nr:ABC transporter permease [Anaerocolumna sp. AGMB13020]WOO37360.1 ABC transporter permease [Anaerocolumna sp. AGMB13020]
MAKNFYLRMAAANLRRDKGMYVPYAISYIIFSAIYFMVVTLMTTDGLKNVPEKDSIKTMFALGMIIMSITTIIFMLYINSFLIKRRKKEFGLYGILGLEKRHISRIIIFENFILSSISLVLGIVSSCVFGNLIFLLLLKTLKVSPDSHFSLNWQPFSITTVLFAIIFVLTTAFNFIQVRTANPIDLLKGEQVGEKKVRFVLLKTLIGTALLVTAYYMANTVKNGGAALNQFFVAVLMVIVATNLLFQAGSQFVLHRLKSRKKFYYKAKNFIAISGLFHRMKQNAAGLANICILSTMVLVTISTCVALYLGQEDIIRYNNPNDLEIIIHDRLSEEKINSINDIIDKEASAKGIMIQDFYRYNRAATSSVFLLNGKILPYNSPEIDRDTPMYELWSQIRGLQVVPLAEYIAVTGDNRELADKEVLLLTDKEDLKLIDMKTLDKDYVIKDTLIDTVFNKGKNTPVTDIFLITADEQNAEKLLENYYQQKWDDASSYKFILNMEGNEKDQLEFTYNLKEKLISAAEGNTITVSSIDLRRQEDYGLFGGLLFLGIFFTIMFLCATVLIIYFKQVSEGYDDRERYEILQKVGMDDREVKKTISRQILLVFFLPLAAAVLHLSAARHMIIKMLESFYLFDTMLSTVCIIGSGVIFAVIYVCVYKFTARTYYRIIKF